MSSPLVRLASLDLIRSFVAVGRRMSITRAADDLCRTQSAVSRQIQALEDSLGVELFRREHRSIRFTPEGERLFRIADRAVRDLQDGFGALSAPEEGAPVTITASIGVASLWLVPRLGRFQQRHPEIDVRVAANNQVLDLAAEDVDLAIRYCDAASAPAAARRLFDESVVPVAHPALGVSRLDEHVLARSVLLEYDDPGRPWLQWSDRLIAAGLTSVRPRGMLRFNQYDQVVHAATEGQGIALGRRALVQPMLSDGRLVALEWAGCGEAEAYAYWLIQAEANPHVQVRRVIDWIIAEAGRQEPDPDG